MVVVVLEVVVIVWPTENSTPSRAPKGTELQEAESEVLEIGTGTPDGMIKLTVPAESVPPVKVTSPENEDPFPPAFCRKLKSGDMLNSVPFLTTGG